MSDSVFTPAGAIARRVCLHLLMLLTCVVPFPALAADLDNDGLSDNLDPDDRVPRYQLSSDGYHTCLIDDIGLHCWGLNSSGQADIPPQGTQLGSSLMGKPLAVTTGVDFSCAITEGQLAFENVVSCWGADGQGQSSPGLLTQAMQLAAGKSHACTLYADGTVGCWGAPTTVPALSNPVSIGAGDNHTCVLDDTGLVCWGGTYGQSTVPAGIGHPEQFALGARHTCAITADGQVQCWGDGAYGQKIVPALSNPRRIAAGGNLTCAIDDDGVQCWGQWQTGKPLPTAPDMTNPTQIAVGYAHACALADEGLVCWAIDGSLAEQAGATVTDLFAGADQILAGDSATCATTSSGLRCYSPDDTLQAPLGLTNVTLLTAYDDTFCARSDEGVSCWSDIPEMAFFSAGINSLSQVALTDGAGCALVGDGNGNSNVSCWGPNALKYNPPASLADKPAQQLWLGSGLVCADFTTEAACWIDGARIELPIEHWDSMVISSAHFCARVSDESLCWTTPNELGDFEAFADNPQADVMDVVGGQNYTCLIRQTSMTCKGPQFNITNYQTTIADLQAVLIGGQWIALKDSTGVIKRGTSATSAVPDKVMFSTLHGNQGAGAQRACGLNGQGVICGGTYRFHLDFIDGSPRFLDPDDDGFENDIDVRPYQPDPPGSYASETLEFDAGGPYQGVAGQELQLTPQSSTFGSIVWDMDDDDGVDLTSPDSTQNRWTYSSGGEFRITGQLTSAGISVTDTAKAHILRDTDGDGSPDQQDRWPELASASLDQDHDNLPDNCVSLQACTLDGLTPDPVLDDRDNDGIADDDDAILYTDSLPPYVQSPPDLHLVSDTAPTSVDLLQLGDARATDIPGVVLTASPNTAGASTTVELGWGHHQIDWCATDASGNERCERQLVEISRPGVHPGDLDQQFGHDGFAPVQLDDVVAKPVGGTWELSNHDAIVDDQGRTLVVGNFSLLWLPGGPRAQDVFVSRYLPSGELDPEFGPNPELDPGIVRFHFLDGGETPAQILQTLDGGYLVSGVATSKAPNIPSYLNDGVLVKLTPDGRVDTEYGRHQSGVYGRSVIRLGDGTALRAVSAQQADGKIVTLLSYKPAPQYPPSYEACPSDYRLFVARTLADGTLDPAFTDEQQLDFGLVPVDVPALDCISGREIFVLADGKLLVLATGRIDGKQKLALVRLNADGSLDDTFANGPGYVIGPPPGINPDGPINVVDATLQADGKLLVAVELGGSVGAVIRYLPSGEFDPAFGPSEYYPGHRIVNVPFLKAVSETDNGTIVVVGGTVRSSFSGKKIALYWQRITAAGNNCTNCNTSTEIGLPDEEYAAVVNSAAILADGSARVFGSVDNDNGIRGPFLYAFNANGATDVGFGAAGDGFVTHELGFRNSSLTDLTVLASGDVVTSGYGATESGYPHLYLAKFHADGERDNAFGNSGFIRRQQPFAAEFDIQSVKTMESADGSLITFGTIDAGAADRWFATRSLADGTLDTSFGGQGDDPAGWASGDLPDYSVVVTDLSSYSSGGYVLSMAQQPTHATSDSSRIILLKTDDLGQPDVTFGESGLAGIAIPATPFPSKALSLAVTPEGQILLAGQQMSSGLPDRAYQALLARVTATGELDVSFGNSGTLDFAIGEAGKFKTFDGIRLLANGDILLAGSAHFSATVFDELQSTAHPFVYRLTSALEADPTFGDDVLAVPGLSVLEAPGALYDGEFHILPTEDIVLAFRSSAKSTTGDAAGVVRVSKLDQSGALDPEFAIGGERTILTAKSIVFMDSVITADGDIITAADDYYTGGYLNRIRLLVPDDDGDGVENRDDAFPDDPSGATDADGDGLVDFWPASCDQTCRDNSTLTLDPSLNDRDNDGVTDEEDVWPDLASAATDADLDGLPDDCFSVAACESDGLTPDPLLSDTDNDGIPDTEDDDNTRDNNPPQVFPPPDIEISASGEFTELNLEQNGTAYATDAPYSVVDVVPQTTGNSADVSLASGQHAVAWCATDAAGNTGCADQIVRIRPLVTISSIWDQVGEGVSVTVTIALSGPPVAFPVQVPVLITNEDGADSSDHDAVSQLVIINQDDPEDDIPENAAHLVFNTLPDDDYGEFGESILFELVESLDGEFLDGAVLGADFETQLRVTISELNLPPTVNLVIPESVEEGVAFIDLDALISDPNGDSLQVRWYLNGVLVAEGVELSGITLLHEEYELAPGAYEVRVVVVDYADSPYEVEAVGTFTITAPVVVSGGSGGSTDGATLLWLLAMLGLLRQWSRSVARATM